MDIPYGRQSISWQDHIAVWKVLRSDYLTVGPMVDKFEQELSALTKLVATSFLEVYFL